MEKKIYDNYMIGDFEYLLQQDWLNKLSENFGRHECVDKYATACWCWKDDLDNNCITTLATDLYLNNRAASRSNNVEIMNITVDEVSEIFDSLCEKQLVDITYEVEHPTLVDDKFILQASLEGKIGDALPEVPNTSAGSIVYNSLYKVVNEFKAMIEECNDYKQLKEVAETLDKLGVVAPEFVKRIATNAHESESGLAKLHSKQEACKEKKDDDSIDLSSDKKKGSHHNEGR